jgi:hypothetical protein
MCKCGTGRNKRALFNGEYACIFSKTFILQEKTSNALEISENYILHAAKGTVAAENKTGAKQIYMYAVILT